MYISYNALIRFKRMTVTVLLITLNAYSKIFDMALTRKIWPYETGWSIYNR